MQMGRGQRKMGQNGVRQRIVVFCLLEASFLKSIGYRAFADDCLEKEKIIEQ
jgi:hypothetical protein